MANAPETPLPWNNDRLDRVGENFAYPIRGANHKLLGAATSEQDASYAKHAANAYPKLVAQLQAALPHLDLTTVGMNARALLRFLGESA